MLVNRAVRFRSAFAALNLGLLGCQTERVTTVTIRDPAGVSLLPPFARVAKGERLEIAKQPAAVAVERARSGEVFVSCRGAHAAIERPLLDGVLLRSEELESEPSVESPVSSDGDALRLSVSMVAPCRTRRPHTERIAEVSIPWANVVAVTRRTAPRRDVMPYLPVGLGVAAAGAFGVAYGFARDDASPAVRASVVTASSVVLLIPGVVVSAFAVYPWLVPPREETLYRAPVASGPFRASSTPGRGDGP